MCIILLWGAAKIALFIAKVLSMRFRFKEYRTLVGGGLYEPQEENPMLGWRGASRYYDPKFKVAFGLECQAMKYVRENMGFTNVVPMIPFCRTPEEGKKVVEVMAEHGLDRALDKTLKVYVMCEIPSNIILADEFLEVFDGMSIGSNDLTQLTLGLIVIQDCHYIANENNPAERNYCADNSKMQGENIYSICGKRVDYPDFAEFLLQEE